MPCRRRQVRPPDHVPADVRSAVRPFNAAFAR
jgi:hypothetical protein